VGCNVLAGNSMGAKGERGEEKGKRETIKSRRDRAGVEADNPTATGED